MTDKSFKSLIQRITAESSVRKNVLVSKSQSCSYALLPAALSAIEAFLDEHVDRADTLEIYGGNSVASALLLLALLAENRSFLFGQESEIARPNDQIVRRTRLDVSPSSCDLLRPETFLRIESPRHDNLSLINQSKAKFYMRTSGSLGVAKLAVHRHDRFVENVLACVERFGLSSADRVALPVPISHLYGLGAALLPSVVAGASIDLQEKANILRFLERDQLFSPTVVFLTPAFCRMLVRHRRSSRGYRLTISAGDVLPHEVFTEYDERFGCLVSLYGCTEIGAIAAPHTEMSKDLRCRTVGYPMTGIEVEIRPLLGQVSDEGDNRGALFVKHPFGFMGYADRTKKTLDEIVTHDGFFATGDLASLDADGLLEIHGRHDHCVNRDGRLVVLSEVETLLARLEGVEQAVVVAGGSSKRGKVLEAFCVLKKGCDHGPAELKNACSANLPRYAIPDAFHTVGKLPYLDSGKVDRRLLITFFGKERTTREQREV